jgi:L-ribulose-5-phosphate 4-epimerase
MLEGLKRDVLEANKLLSKHNLVTFTWGYVSGIDRRKGIIIVKPQEVPYDTLTVDDMITADMNGSLIEGRYPVPIDIAAHIEIYKAFPTVNAITHTTSRWATIFSQMGMGIPALGTIHAEYFHGEIPCTRKLRAYEIRGDYDRETGAVIVERIRKGKLSYEEMPGILVCNHGPFTWGSSPAIAVHNAIVLEEVAFMAWHCMALPDKYLVPMQKDLLERHYSRKHGSNAIYGLDDTDNSFNKLN